MKHANPRHPSIFRGFAFSAPRAIVKLLFNHLSKRIGIFDKKTNNYLKYI